MLQSVMYHSERVDSVVNVVLRYKVTFAVDFVLREYVSVFYILNLTRRIENYSNIILKFVHIKYQDMLFQYKNVYGFRITDIFRIKRNILRGVMS